MAMRDHLNDFEQLILLSILRVEGDAYGSSIQRDLLQTANRSASVASIYVALARLEEQGLVSSWMADPTTKRGGRSKRCYRVERAGIRALQRARTQFDRMWAGVDPVLDPRTTKS